MLEERKGNAWGTRSTRVEEEIAVEEEECVWGPRPTLLTSAGSASINVDDGGAQLVLRQQCGHTPPLVPTPHGPTFGKYCSLFTPFCLLLYHSSFGVPLYYPSIIPRIFFPLFLLVFCCCITFT